MGAAPARLRAGLAASLLAGLVALAGCAPTRLETSPAYVPRRPPVAQPPRVVPSGGEGVDSLANLPGWADEDHAAALRAFQDGCPAAREPDLRLVCVRARAMGPADDLAARIFFETSFRPVILPGPGLLTAYFAPVYPARREPDAVFSAAVRGAPPDLTYGPRPLDQPQGRRSTLQLGAEGASWPYPDRAGIELIQPDRALAWMRPEDLFFLQIQGSGVLVFSDGRRAKASYAADNGRPFVPIAGAMVRAGLLERPQASAANIRTWLRDHAGAQAQTAMDLDPRYVFFKLDPDDGREPAGAAGLPLTAGRAIAVDPAYHGYGELYWVDATAPTLRGAVRRYRRLVVALDTGSAIRGDVRADLYLGRGDAAGEEAGRVRHTLLLVRLAPVTGGRAEPVAGIGREAAASTGGR